MAEQRSDRKEILARRTRPRNNYCRRPGESDWGSRCWKNGSNSSLSSGNDRLRCQAWLRALALHQSYLTSLPPSRPYEVQCVAAHKSDFATSITLTVKLPFRICYTVRVSIIILDSCYVRAGYVPFQRRSLAARHRNRLPSVGYLVVYALYV